MAEPRAVINIVGAEADAHEFLEQIGLLVRGFCRAEAGERLAAVAVADGLEARRRTLERLVPGGGAEMRPRIGWIDRVVGVFAHAVLADERLRQPVRMAHIVEAEAALDAEPVFIRR